MWKQVVFDGIVLGCVGRIVRDADFDANLIGESLQVLLEDVVTAAVAAPTVAKHQDRGCVRIVETCLVVPPVTDAVTSELTGIVTGTQIDVASVTLHIIDAVGDDDAFCLTVEVVVVDL